MRNSILIGIYLGLPLITIQTQTIVPNNSPDQQLQAKYRACNAKRVALLQSCDQCGLLAHINSLHTQLQAQSGGVDLKKVSPDVLNGISSLNKQIAVCCKKFLNSLSNEEKNQLQELCKERAELQKKMYYNTQGESIDSDKYYNQLFI